MFKKLPLTFLLIFSSFLIIYPSKKENVGLIDYCYSLEKILSRNAVEESKSLSNNLKPFAKDFSLFSIKKSKGALANNIIDQYKNSKKLFIITFVPNQIYCFLGYWVEALNPGTFKSILYDKSKQKINKYNNIKKEVEEIIKDIDAEYKSIKKDINKLF